MQVGKYNKRAYQKESYRIKAIERSEERLKFKPTIAMELDFSTRLKFGKLYEKLSANEPEFIEVTK